MKYLLIALILIGLLSCSVVIAQQTERKEFIRKIPIKFQNSALFSDLFGGNFISPTDYGNSNNYGGYGSSNNRGNRGNRSSGSNNSRRGVGNRNNL